MLSCRDTCSFGNVDQVSESAACYFTDGLVRNWDGEYLISLKAVGGEEERARKPQSYFQSRVRLSVFVVSLITEMKTESFTTGELVKRSPEGVGIDSSIQPVSFRCCWTTWICSVRCCGMRSCVYRDTGHSEGM